MKVLFLLLVLFQLKHLVADYLLQGRYMLGKFKDKGFVLPLLSHSAVHGAFTLAICLVFAPHLWWLSLVDVVSHFFIDRLKAGPKYLGRYKALSGKEFMEEAHILLEAEKYEADNEHLIYDHSFDAYTKELGQRAVKRIKSNQIFWWCLGGDQLAHHLVHYLIIAFLVGVI
jgi:hypothetical protein